MDTDVLEYRFGPIFRGEKFDKFFNIKVSNLNLIPQTWSGGRYRLPKSLYWPANLQINLKL
jgi:hypothetical protein